MEGGDIKDSMNTDSPKARPNKRKFRDITSSPTSAEPVLSVQNIPLSSAMANRRRSLVTVMRTAKTHRPATSFSVSSDTQKAPQTEPAAPKEISPAVQELNPYINGDSYFGYRIRTKETSEEELKIALKDKEILTPAGATQLKENKGRDVVIVGMLGTIPGPTQKARNKSKSSYVSWRLCDKKGASISVFLFDDACTQWTSKGAVEGGIYAILNPTYYRSKQRTSSALSVKNADQILFIGPWADFARCKAPHTDGGKECGVIIDASKQEFCTYHVHLNYNKVRSSRMEFNAGFGGPSLPKKPSSSKFQHGTFEMKGAKVEINNVEPTAQPKRRRLDPTVDKKTEEVFLSALRFSGSTGSKNMMKLLELQGVAVPGAEKEEKEATCIPQLARGVAPGGTIDL